MKTKSIEINGETVYLFPKYGVNAMIVASEYLEAIGKILDPIINANDDDMFTEGLLRCTASKINLLSKCATFDTHQLLNPHNMATLARGLSRADDLRLAATNCRTIIDNNKEALIIHTPVGDMNALDVNIFSEMIHFVDARLKSTYMSIKNALDNDMFSALSSNTLKKYSLDSRLYKQLIALDSTEYNEDSIEHFINDNYLRLTGICKETDHSYFQSPPIQSSVFSFLTLADVYHHPIDVMGDMPEVPLPGAILELVCDYM